MRKIASILAILIIAPMFVLTAMPVGAADLDINHAFTGNTDDWTGIRNNTGLGSTDPRTIAANVINILLGFLGIIAVVLVLAGGFMWMTAAGNEDKVAQAKKVMSAGVIGLIIVLAAFGIAKFVVDALVTATK